MLKQLLARQTVATVSLLLDHTTKNRNRVHTSFLSKAASSAKRSSARYSDVFCLVKTRNFVQSARGLFLNCMLKLLSA